MSREVPNFGGFVGKTDVTDVVRRHVEGSKLENRPFPNTLLRGGPGLGKSMLARAIASELGTKCRKFEAAKSMRSSDLCAILSELAFGDVLFIDEAHLLNDDVQDYLLGAVGERRSVQLIVERRGAGAASCDETISVAEFALILATNYPGRIRPALLSRVSLPLDLDVYSAREMREIIIRRCAAADLRVSTHSIRLLVAASRGVPRSAEHFVGLLKTYYPRVGRELTIADVREFLRAHGFDGQFLKRPERVYMKALEENHGPARLSYLEAYTGLDSATLRRQIEPELQRRHLIKIVGSERMLINGNTPSPPIGVTDDTEE